MDMEDGLTRVAVGVEDRAVSAGRNPTIGRDCRRAPHYLADDPIVVRAEIVQRRDMLLRDDQHVRRGLRVDVVERENPIILVDDRRRDLTADDFAEEAVGHGRKFYFRRVTAVRAMP